MALRVTFDLGAIWAHLVFNLKSLLSGLVTTQCLMSDNYIKGSLPPETEARNRKLTVFAMSLYLFFCVLWAYFVVTGGMSTNRGLQEAKFEE